MKVIWVQPEFKKRNLIYYLVLPYMVKIRHFY